MIKSVDWELVSVASDMEKRGLVESAMKILTAAIIVDSNTTVEDTLSPEINGELHAYGLNGYTDALDPRDLSAKRHSTDRPHSSVHTIVYQLPNVKYKVKRVEAYGPVDTRGGGRHVAYVSTPASFMGSVILATGHKGNPNDFDQEISHSIGQEVVIDGKFTVPNLGPLAIYLKEGGKRVSDVVGNLGLPDGDHFSYRIIFEAV